MQRFRINENKISEGQRSSKFFSLIAIIGIILQIYSIDTLSIITIPLMLILFFRSYREYLYIKCIEEYRDILPADKEIQIIELAQAMHSKVENVTNSLKFLISKHYIEGAFNNDGTAVTLFSENKYMNLMPNAIKTSENTNLTTENMIQCGKCGMKNQMGIKFCPECGASLINICSECEKPINDKKII